MLNKFPWKGIKEIGATVALWEGQHAAGVERKFFPIQPQFSVFEHVTVFTGE